MKLISKVITAFLKRRSAIGPDSEALRQLHWETELPEYQKLRERMRQVKKDNSDIGGRIREMGEIEEPNLPEAIQKILQQNGRVLPQYDPHGGYPVMYMDRTGESLCAECAMQGVRGENRNNIPLGYFVHYEGPPEICADCGEKIESAYGDPSENDK